MEDGVTVLSSRTGPQSRPAAESTGLEATFPEATPLAQAAPLAGVDTPPPERGILPSDCASSSTGSSTDDLDLGIEFSATAGWGCELGLVEETPARYPSPRALLPRLGWDDELQKPGAQVYMHFMQEHTCYDAMATSSKLVIFDTTLEVRPPLHPISILTALQPPLTPSRTPCQARLPARPFQDSSLASWIPVWGGLLFSVSTPSLSLQLCHLVCVASWVGYFASLISKMGIGMPALPYKFQKTPGTTQDKWEHFVKP